MGKIPLADVINVREIAAPRDFKLHAARKNRTKKRALYLYCNNTEGWEDMHKWRSKKNDFNKDYIFSVMRFDPEEDMWLFGGIYKVVGRGGEEGPSYEVEKLLKYSWGIGVLKIKWPNSKGIRNRSLILENHLDRMFVTEFLPKDYKLIQNCVDCDLPSCRCP